MHRLTINSAGQLVGESEEEYKQRQRPMIVTLFSPNPKIKPVQFEVTDIICWARLTYYYLMINVIPLGIGADKAIMLAVNEDGSVSHDSRISPLAYINIHHRMLSMLLKEYFGYFPDIEELRKLHSLSADELLAIEQDQLDIARQSKDYLTGMIKPVPGTVSIISTTGGGPDNTLHFRARTITN